jgi:hypothetical protein
MIRRIFLALTVIVAFVSCEKELDTSVSDCIQERLKTFDTNEACDNASVHRFQFQGGFVYTFDRGNCAEMDSIEVRSENCDLLGYLGGYLNNASINGIIFYGSAKHDAIVWARQY